MCNRFRKPVALSLLLRSLTRLVKAPFFCSTLRCNSLGVTCESRPTNLWTDLAPDPVWPGAALPSSRGRPANDEFCFQIVVRTFSPFQLQHPIQCLEGGRPHPLAGNSDGGQRLAGHGSKRGVVNAGHRKMFPEHAPPLFAEAPRAAGGQAAARQ